MKAQCERLIDGFKELAERTGEAVINFVNAELYLNGVPLKPHSGKMEDPAVLAANADKVRAALNG